MATTKLGMESNPNATVVDDAVEDAAGSLRGDERQRDGDHQRDELRVEQQLDRDRQPLLDGFRHRLLVDGRRAHVAGERVAQPR